MSPPISRPHSRRLLLFAGEELIWGGHKAIITVATRNQTKNLRTSFAGRISDEPAIVQAFGVTGELDAVLIGNFSDMEEYQALCDRLFDTDPDVVRYTLFAVETYKDTTAVEPSERRKQ